MKINIYSIFCYFLITFIAILASMYGVYALVPGDIGNQVFFLDAQNIDADGNDANEPSNNTTISEIVDSFNTNTSTGTQNITSKMPLYKTDEINQFPALSFDGSNDIMYIHDSLNINTNQEFTQKSLATIIKTGSDITTFQSIYEQGGKEKGFSVQIEGGKLYAGVYNSVDWTGGSELRKIDFGIITADTTYTIIFVYDEVNDEIRGYLDGVLTSALSVIEKQKTHGICMFDSGLGCSIYSTGTSIGIGGTLNDIQKLSDGSEIELYEGHYFDGSIGEIIQWNQGLTNTESIGIHDYFKDKWYGDIIMPTVISSNFGNNAVLPGGNHDLIFNYDDFHEGSSGIDVNSDSISLRKWNGTSYGGDISGTGLSLGSKSVNTMQAIYPMDNLLYGKYEATFTISDNKGNISPTKTLIFYVDEPTMIVSSGSADISNLSAISETYAPDITVTVKTIGVPFRVKLQKNQPLTDASSSISYYNGTTGFGFDKNNNGTLDDIGINEIIATESRNTNTNGLLNTYTYTVKVGALISAQQQAGDYSGLINFGIDLDYMSEYAAPTVETSCKTLLDKYGTNISSGEYIIKPGVANINVYCDMEIAGGGWTMVKRAGKLGRNGKPDSDRIGVMVEDGQMGVDSDLVPSGSEFAKMSDTQINSINFSEIMIHQDSTGDRVFILDNIIDSDHLIVQADLWVYKKGTTGVPQISALNSTTNGCSKYGIYITEDTSATPNGGGYRSCAGSMVVSDGGYIHTFEKNGFGVNQSWVYTDAIGDEWVR